MAPSNPSMQSEAPADEAAAINPLAGMLQGLLKWSALLITLGGLTLHVAGYIYHEEYIKAWGLDPDLFPKSVEWVLINGYQIIANSIAELWLFILGHKIVVLLWAFLTGTATALCVLWAKKTGRHEFSPLTGLLQKLKSTSETFRIFFFSYLYVGAITLVLFFAPIFALAFLYLPATLATKLARTEAQNQQAIYALGCEHTNQTARCITVRRGNKPELTGFLIDSSDKHLALYLPGQKQVQVIEREGVEVVVE